MQKTDLLPEYMDGSDAAAYLKTTERKIALYRSAGLLKFSKLGKGYVYKRSWLDDFMQTWAGYDLSNKAAVSRAINERKWKQQHCG